MRIRTAMLMGAVGLLVLQFLPSGAGQHFGIIVGDYVTTPAAPPGGGTPILRLSFFSGLGLSATDDPSLSQVSVLGSVSVRTPLGTDVGCLRDETSTPTLLGDPALRQATLHVQVPSKTYPGGTISVDLTFVADSSPPQPAAGAGEEVRVILQQSAAATGTVVSSSIGSTSVAQDGTIGRGVTVDAGPDTSCPF